MTTRLLWVTKQIWDQVSLRILHKLFTPCLESNWDSNHIWLLKIQAIPETELATWPSSAGFKGPSGIIVKFRCTSCTRCSALAHGPHLISWNRRNPWNLYQTDFSVPESREHLFWKRPLSSRIEKILTFCCDNKNQLSRLHAHAHGEQIVHLMIWKQVTHGRHLMILETQVRPGTYSIAALWKEIERHRSSE